MPEQRSPLSPYAPGGPGTDLAQAVRNLASARAVFLSTGDLPGELLRPIVGDSWRRCRELRVDVERRHAAPGVASEDELAELRAASAPLIAAAQPVLQRLGEVLTDVGYVVALGDPGARLLEMGGNPDLLRRLAQLDFLPGSDWSEAMAGTNAIGTALASGRVVQLIAAEHYCEGWQDVTCTAAPIRCPHTGALLGALDITGDYRLAQPFLRGYLSAAARAVEQNLRAGVDQPGPRLWLGYAAPLVVEPAAELRRARLAERLAVAAGMISASLDPATTAARVAAQAALVFAAPWAAVGRFDRTGALRLAARAGVWPDDVGPLLAALEPEITALRDWSEPALLSCLPAAAAPALPSGAGAAALLPLSPARGASGAILVLRRSGATWDADELRAGLTLAAQAATAIENAELVARLQQQHEHTAALNALGHLLRTLVDPFAQLDLIVDTIVALTGFDHGAALFFVQPHGQPVRAAYSAGMRALPSDHEPADGPPQASAIALLHAPLHALITAAIEAGTCVIWCAEDDATPRARDACDLLAIPLALSGGNPGVLALISQQHRPDLAADRNLLTLIAQQLALTLRTSRLVRAAGEREGLRTADQLKSTFLAAVSHDLRSPLTALRTTVESLLDRGDGLNPGERTGMLQHIGRQVGRLSRLVDQLLDLTQIEAGAFRIDRDWIDPAVLIADTFSAFNQMDHGHLLQQQIASDLPLHYVDPDRIAQVLWNLLENAVKYSPAGTPIDVVARASLAGLVIEVADRGAGVPADQREQIFDHFYRLPSDRRAQVPGCGLGLAICRGIIHAHGGTIWVEARAGGGSCFRLRLPPPPADPADLEEIVDDFRPSSQAHS